MQRVERLTRSIGVRANVWKLAPTSILILSGLQCLHERSAFGCGRAGIRERIELHRSFFRGESLSREQPPFGSLDPLLELLAAARNGIELDRPQHHCRRRKRTILCRWSVARVSKCAVRILVKRHVMNMRVGQYIRRSAGR